MWEMITTRINLKKNTQYDFRDIEVILTRNLPTNNKEITDNWLKLRGLLSDKTVIDHLPYDLDSESEIAQMDTQNEVNIEKNMKNMQKVGQDTNAMVLNTQQGNLNKQLEQTDEVKKEKIKQSDNITNKKVEK